MTGGDAGDQSATAEAVQLQNLLIEARLSRRRTLYLDSTNVEAEVRVQLVERARRHGRPLPAIATNLPKGRRPVIDRAPPFFASGFEHPTPVRAEGPAAGRYSGSWRSITA
ncbi:hypothetical protein [Kitasatospora sp. NPDC051914]|uniref:hypothetical protein n=1 Tax=Kitasatospora sp. NPDC051914 TaxID=3154945 RepID=UPI00344314D0